MGMTSKQDLPIKNAEKSAWSSRRLFPLADVSKAFAKTFINVFDVLSGFSILIVGLCELLNREVSWLFYAVTILLVVGAFAERNRNTSSENKEHK